VRILDLSSRAWKASAPYDPHDHDRATRLLLFLVLSYIILLVLLSAIFYSVLPMRSRVFLLLYAILCHGALMLSVRLVLTILNIQQEGKVEERGKDCGCDCHSVHGP
jgi:hypothetical protein